MHRVIDTNVLIVANNRESDQASPECITSCATWLEKFKKEGILVIDSNWLIISEYKKKVNQLGQPGVGDAFLRWVLLNHGNSNRCHQVSITKISEHEFKEFPKTESLEKFDLSDRKFVAVALTHPQRPAIVNAVDSDWYNHQNALSEHKVQIEFLCDQNQKS
jgi:hypothetical protein